MKTLKQSCGLIVMFFLVVLASCSDDDAPAILKSSDKAITAFKFSGLNPEVVATITESAKTITATVPAGTDRTKLVPTVTISDKASVSPATGVAQDFTAPVKYTVTAEDGTKQEYAVTVTETAPTFTVTRYSITSVEQQGGLVVIGTGFGSFDQVKIVLKNSSTGATVEIKAASTSSATLLAFAVPADLPLGDYTGTIFVGSEAAAVPGKITVVVASPTITSIDKTTVIGGETITITGKNFKASGNVVKISKSGSTTWILNIVSESTTEIKVKIPSSLDLGVYTPSINTTGKDIFFNNNKITVEADPNTPTITNINKTTITGGETLVITGTKFKKAGVVTYINFLPWPNGGQTLVRNGVVNADGTEITYTLNSGFPAGQYEVLVEVDGLFSETYIDIIKVN